MLPAKSYENKCGQIFNRHWIKLYDTDSENINQQTHWLNIQWKQNLSYIKYYTIKKKQLVQNVCGHDSSLTFCLHLRHSWRNALPHACLAKLLPSSESPCFLKHRAAQTSCTILNQQWSWYLDTLGHTESSADSFEVRAKQTGWNSAENCSKNGSESLNNEKITQTIL